MQIPVYRDRCREQRNTLWCFRSISPAVNKWKLSRQMVQVLVLPWTSKNNCYEVVNWVTVYDRMYIVWTEQVGEGVWWWELIRHKMLGATFLAPGGWTLGILLTAEMASGWSCLEWLRMDGFVAGWRCGHLGGKTGTLSSSMRSLVQKKRGRSIRENIQCRSGEKERGGMKSTEERT